jgi:hypothetical protein
VSSANRSIQNLPQRSEWFATSTDFLFAESGAIVSGVGKTSRIWVTYFTDAQPQQLNDGEYEYIPGN